ncbi:MAG: RecQ family ATP-dependent DNA helicase, partial [Prochlorotrichaceae cyanobacterium]
CGHNFRRFDYPYFLRSFPEFNSGLVIDTLELSILSFPLLRSHRLDKIYKSSEYAINNPLEDALATKQLLGQIREELSTKPLPLLRLYGYLLSCRQDPASAAYSSWFSTSIRVDLDTPPPIDSLPLQAIEGMDTTYLAEFLEQARSKDFNQRLCLTGIIAWHYESQLSETRPPLAAWLNRLDQAASLLNHLKPLKFPQEFTYQPYLQTFNLSSFRGKQEEAVQSILAADNPLILMATGAGKSLCYQLPALMIAQRQKGLTIVISPLQALMIDQVSNLMEKGLNFATYINGGLHPRERGERLEQLRSGEKDLLYISAEQLRSPSIRALLRDRLPSLIVFDEAHCISQWGHDFRPDYRYAPKFIAELYHSQSQSFSLKAFPLMAFMTATATVAVRQDIKALFAQYQIPITTEICAPTKRENLTYTVIPTAQKTKEQTLLTIVQNTLPEKGGAIIIYTSTCKNTERLASLLQEHQIKARFYHGKIPQEDKAEILQQFKSQALNVVVATCAFGMGIDRSDVRAVIHHTMSSNLESYVQEAGRAGRDGKPATCTLLFDPLDADTAFFLQSLNQLSEPELRNLFLAIRELRDFIYGREKVSEQFFWATSTEIFRTSYLDQEFANTDDQRDLKIKAALHYLESFGMIEREENQSVFISFNLSEASPEDSLVKFQSYAHHHHFPEYRRILFEKLITAMHLAKTYAEHENQPYPLERLSDASGLAVNELKKYLKELERAEVCTAEIPITLLITKGVRGDSRRKFQQHQSQEQQIYQALLQLLGDRPDLQINCRALATHLDPDRQQELTATMILEILEGWHFLKWLRYDRVRSDVIKITAFSVTDYFQSFQHGVGILIDILYEAIGDQKGGRLRLRQDLGLLLTQVNQRLSPQVWELEDLEKALAWMHKTKLVRLTEGSNLFYQSMKIRVIKGVQENKISREYPKIVKPHYEDQIRRTHIMLQYGAQHKNADFVPQDYIAAYFALSDVDFLTQYSPLRKKMTGKKTEEMTRALSVLPVLQEDYDRIITPLNPIQRQIILAEDLALAIIAGPGSGKTRTIVHRIAYLVKVKRVNPDRIIVLAYNRNAVRELRLRLQRLVGELASRLRVHTFHGLALAILGRTIEPTQRTSDPTLRFNQLIEDACHFIEGNSESLEEADHHLRIARLLGHCEYIFVDEYQDVAAHEYRLVKLIAGLQVSEEHRPSVQTQICIIGDDDQNIYEWRGTSSQYIRSFQAEYQAKQFLLTENYRSTESIIAAANRLIKKNSDRLKRSGNEQVRIDNDRVGQTGLAVHSLQFDTDQAQAEYIKCQVEKWIHQEGLKPGEIAILARHWQNLDQARALLEMRAGIATYTLKGQEIKLIRNRSTQLLLRALEKTPNEILSPTESVQDRFATFFSCHHYRLSEPTVQQLMQIAADLDQERGYGTEQWSTEMAIHEIITSIYEFNESPEVLLDPNAVLVTSCHGAKGLEFKSVILIADGFDDRSDQVESERRLFYVAMTRAQEKLLLTLLTHSQPSQLIQETGAIPYPVETIAINPPQFVFYADLTPQDIHLGFAGTQAKQHLIQSLREGDPLNLIPTKNGQNWTIRHQNQVLGLLAQKAVKDLAKRHIYPGKFIFQPGEVTVRNIYRHLITHEITGEPLEDWYVVIPKIRICR